MACFALPTIAVNTGEAPSESAKPPQPVGGRAAATHRKLARGEERIMENVSRRNFVIAAAGALGTLGLAACGNTQQAATTA